MSLLLLWPKWALWCSLFCFSPQTPLVFCVLSCGYWRLKDFDWNFQFCVLWSQRFSFFFCSFQSNFLQILEKNAPHHFVRMKAPLFQHAWAYCWYAWVCVFFTLQLAESVVVRFGAVIHVFMERAEIVMKIRSKEKSKRKVVLCPSSH